MEVDDRSVTGRGHPPGGSYLHLPRGGLSVSIGRSPMGSLGFTLADRLGAKSLPCSVHGCTRTWISLAGSGKGLKLGGRAAPDPNDPSSAMCDPCREKFAQPARRGARLRSRPGCDGTWTWPAAAQLTRVRDQAAAADRAVRALRGEAGRARGQDRPLLGARAARASSVFTQEGAAAGRRARRRAAPRPPRCAGRATASSRS